MRPLPAWRKRAFSTKSASSGFHALCTPRATEIFSSSPSGSGYCDFPRREHRTANGISARHQYARRVLLLSAETEGGPGLEIRVRSSRTERGMQSNLRRSRPASGRVRTRGSHRSSHGVYQLRAVAAVADGTSVAAAARPIVYWMDGRDGGANV